jgi:chorismate synthase
MSNTFGDIFKVTTWGESHGGAVGCVIDGCPPGLSVSENDFSVDLDRRRTGQSKLTSARSEEDRVEILSGVFEGVTLGTPISLLVWNKNANPDDYRVLKDLYRPSHADFTYDKKYGVRNWQGGGRASARETTARVMAGVVAKKLLGKMDILAYVKNVHGIEAKIDPVKITLKQVEANDVRCPDKKVAARMEKEILKVRKQGDTIGGVVECRVLNVPVGLGDPVFGKIKAKLADGMMGLPATMGFEIGSGFGCIGMKGSEHNDVFASRSAKTTRNPSTGTLPTAAKNRERVIYTKSNHSGGQQGGITNGMPLVFRVVFKPVSTIFKKQKTVNNRGQSVDLQMIGRHDPCVLPRAVVMVESMAALVLADVLLQQRIIELFK